MPKSRKNSFILYTDQREVLDDLSREEKGDLFDAIFVYAESGEIPSFEDRTLMMAFRLFKMRLDHDGKKYEEICEKNAENQRRRWEKIRERMNTTVYDRIETNTNGTDNDNDNDNDNDSDNELQEPKGSMSNNKKRDKSLYLPEFDEDWCAYHKKGSKKAAFAEWKKLSESEKEQMRKHIPFYWQSNGPQYLKDFERYIKHRVYESPVYDKKKGSVLYDPEMFDKYLPALDRVMRQPDGTFLYYGNFHDFEDVVIDGYDSSNRPDGATLVMNNNRGTITWKANEKKWEVKK